MDVARPVPDDAGPESFNGERGAGSGPPVESGKAGNSFPADDVDGNPAPHWQGGRSEDAPDARHCLSGETKKNYKIDFQ